VANSVAQLEGLTRELRRQATASTNALHTIRARTSRVMRATAAFAALTTDIDALARRLTERDSVARLRRDADERIAFMQDLHVLVDQLESFQQLYAEELSSVAPPPSPAAKQATQKRRWRIWAP
jgi:hypothetical protein